LLLASAFSGEGDLRPVHAVGEHKVFPSDLTTLLEILSGIYHGVDALVERDHVYGDSVVRFRGAVVDEPKTDVGLGRMRIAGLGGDQAEPAPRM
jgi:hypothetical protein